MGLRWKYIVSLVNRLSCKHETRHYSNLYSQLIYLQFNRVQLSDKPEARILLGASLIPEDIREGTDVYFDCIVDGLPNIYKVEWRLNVSIV